MSRAVLLGVLLLCGCGSSVPAPVVQSVSPVEAPENFPTVITVQLDPAFPAMFDYGKRTVTLDTRVTLRIGGQEVPVESVEAQRLTAVVPAGLPVGYQEVRVTLADGREGVLSPGFKVLPAIEAAFSITVPPTEQPTVGQSFTITISKEGPDKDQFQGTVTLMSGRGRLLPRTSGSFVRGARSETITIDVPGQNWVIATDEEGNQGASKSFLVKNKG